MLRRICDAGWILEPLYQVPDGSGEMLWAAEREDGDGAMHFRVTAEATRPEVLRAFAWAVSPRERRDLPTFWLCRGAEPGPFPDGSDWGGVFSVAFVGSE